MSIFCPVIGNKVTYLVCQECDDKVCKQPSYVKIGSSQEKITDVVSTSSGSSKRC